MVFHFNICITYHVKETNNNKKIKLNTKAKPINEIFAKTLNGKTPYKVYSPKYVERTKRKTN